MKKTLLLLSLLFFLQISFAQQADYFKTINIARSLASAGDFKNSALQYSKALSKSKNIVPSHYYNAACSWSMAGNQDAAFRYLNIIVGKTYFNYDHLIKDQDLTALHGARNWKRLLSKIKNVEPQKLRMTALYEDFDLTIAALKEAHPGLYWYTTKMQFDSMASVQKAKIRASMTSLQFYNVILPVVECVKEGHTFVRLDPVTQAFMQFRGRFFPLYIKIINQKVYVMHDYGALKLKGMLLTKINGLPIDSIMKTFLSYEPSDGFNQTSKYKWIEENAKFNLYFSRCFPQNRSFSIQVKDAETNEVYNHQDISSIGLKQLKDNYSNVLKTIPNASYVEPATLKFIPETNSAVLTVNSFSQSAYKNANIVYRDFISQAFEKIRAQRSRNLIIDIRNNGGGSEGYEDYLFSYLVHKDYQKYYYVQASAYSFSFYEHTDYKMDWLTLDSIMKAEHKQSADGRLLRKDEILPHQKPQQKPFTGNIYVLTSGLTYSAGATFVTLLKNYTNAFFIGEEVGGGYYGNSSGIRLTLLLPHSKLEIGIPLLKFSLVTKDEKVPFGHGLQPDLAVQPTISQFLNGYDAEMEAAKTFIKNKM
jgi:hypothetical protein